jgi:hypothetical protein
MASTAGTVAKAGASAAFPWASLAFFLPTLFGGLFGKNDPAKERERKLMEILSPGHANQLTSNFYNQFLNSPAFSQGQAGIAAGTNAFTNNLNRSLGARGLTTSGIGSIAPSLARSSASHSLGALQTQGFQSAQEQAMNLLRSQAGALGGTAMPTNYGNQLFGAGLDAFGPFFSDWLRKTYQVPGQQPQVTK